MSKPLTNPRTGQVETDDAAPTEGDDSLTGTAGRDVIDGLGGNDIIYGLAGNDKLIGAAGNDHLSGDQGNDRLIGRDGNDNLWGGDGNDTLIGNSGADNLTGSYDDDTLIGGSGADDLFGGYGDDTYVFGFGAGSDYLYEIGGAADRISLGAGVTTSDVTLSRNSDDLILTLSTGKALTVADHFYFDRYYHNRVDSIEFADGTVWDSATINGIVSGAAGARSRLAYDADDSDAGSRQEITVVGTHASDEFS